MENGHGTRMSAMHKCMGHDNCRLHHWVTRSQLQVGAVASHLQPYSRAGCSTRSVYGSPGGCRKSRGLDQRLLGPTLGGGRGGLLKLGNYAKHFTHSFSLPLLRSSNLPATLHTPLPSPLSILPTHPSHSIFCSQV